MKVVLLQDIPKVGRKYEVKEVADGFARNVLLKGNKAMMADAGALKKVEVMKQNILASEADSIRAFQKLTEALEHVTLLIKAKANPEGHLFAGLRGKDIAEALAKQTGIKIKPEFVVLEKPIKTTGNFTVTITNGEPQARHLETPLRVVVSS